ncbi:MAG: hypothetical protein ABSF62_12265 [Bryobacteraceae bacterium]
MSVWVTGESLWYQVFPWRRGATPDEFADQEIKKPEQQKNIDALATAVGRATDEAVLKELRDIATAKVRSEEERQASITTRAQGLFAALTLFGFVLAFAATLLTTSTVISRAAMITCGLIAFYAVVQVVVMVINILQATGGIGAKTAGSSDLASWAEKKVANYYRAQALAYLGYYRRHSLTNTWRFTRLEDAVRGVRNTVVSLGIFALTLFAFAIFRPNMPLGPTKAIAAMRRDTSLKVCTVSGFAPAQHQVPNSGVEGLTQTPVGCFYEIQRSICSGEAAFAVIVGHADKRELGQQPQRYYGSNLSLGYQRALEIEGEIVRLCGDASGAGARGDLSARILTLAGGSANVGLNPEEASLGADRSVEIRSYTLGITPTDR